MFAFAQCKYTPNKSFRISWRERTSLPPFTRRKINRFQNAVKIARSVKVYSHWAFPIAMSQTDWLNTVLWGNFHQKASKFQKQWRNRRPPCE